MENVPADKLCDEAAADELKAWLPAEEASVPLVRAEAKRPVVGRDQAVRQLLVIAMPAMTGSG